MPIGTERLQYLLRRYAGNNCTRAELLELFRVIGNAENDELLHDSLRDIWQNITEDEAFPAIDKEQVFNHIMTTAPVRKLPRRSRIGLRVAAAVIFILLSGSAVYLFRRQKNPLPETVAAANHFNNDVLPGGNKAVLTLSDGSHIVLDNAHTGSLAQQGNTRVVKPQNGQLAYRPGTGDGTSTASLYNTITVPRGGQYRVELPDGTRVWLDAASSLKFPAAFSGTERKVILTGQAYFEVASKRNQPFRVLVNNMNVEVLGTHFNIMAYTDEEAIRATLLEGAVRVEGAGAGVVALAPGQQAVLRNDNLKVLDDVNTDEVTAWKNELFDFRKADIHAVMRQLTRWYDIDVHYSAGLQGRFYAKIPRNLPLSDVLKALAMTGKVHFTIEGKKVTVMP